MAERAPRVSAYAHPAPASAIVGGRAAVSLDTAYAICRELNEAHGRTYYFATRFLQPDQRRHVHALYGFARYADDLVDHLALDWAPPRRRAALEAWTGEVLAVLDGAATVDPILTAMADTVARVGVDVADVRAFLASMAMDLEVTRYETYDELSGYVHGSAAVIGAMLLPILGTQHPDARARAMDLGVAFQLTNFLRDVAEDFERGRIYLPLEDLERFGVTERDFRARHVTPAFRRLLAFEIERTRGFYRRAEQGWAMLHPRSRRCVRIAHRLYAGILDRIEAADYQVFRVRATVPGWQKATIAARELLAPAGTDR